MYEPDQACLGSLRPLGSKAKKKESRGENTVWQYGNTSQEAQLQGNSASCNSYKNVKAKYWKTTAKFFMGINECLCLVPFAGSMNRQGHGAYKQRVAVIGSKQHNVHLLVSAFIPFTELMNRQEGGAG